MLLLKEEDKRYVIEEEKTSQMEKTENQSFPGMYVYKQQREHT